MSNTVSGVELLKRDAIVIGYMEGSEAVPTDAGDGFHIAGVHGGIQLAFYWTDRTTDPPTRRSVLIQGGMLRFFDSLSETLGSAVAAVRKGKTCEFSGQLGKERGAGS